MQFLTFGDTVKDKVTGLEATIKGIIFEDNLTVYRLKTNDGKTLLRTEKNLQLIKEAYNDER